MNRNYTFFSPIKKTWASILFLILSAIYFCHRYVYRGAADGGNYMGAMDHDYVSDWHSVLFYKELVIWKKICVFFGDLLNLPLLHRTDIQFFLICAIFHIILAFVLFLLYKKLIEININYIWIGIPWLLIIYFSKRYLPNYWGNLESFNLICLSCSFIILTRLRNTGCVRNIIFFSLFLILAIHIVDFRRNAWIVIPIFAYSIATQCSFYKHILFKRILVTATVVLAVFAGSYTVKKIVSHKETHSASVMLVSDMKMAAILLDATTTEEEWLAHNCKLQHPQRTKNKLRADSDNKPLHSNQLDVLGRNALNDTQWQKLQQRYISYWKEHTYEMLWVRLISSMHLYWDINFPETIKKSLTSQYPHLTDKAFELPSKPVWESNVSQKVHSLTLISSLITFIAYISLLLKNKEIYDRFDKIILTTITICFLYYLSYLVIVPAAFARYLGTPMLITWFITPVMCIRCFLICTRKKQRTDVD